MNIKPATGTVTIPLTKGYEAIIDSEDYPSVIQHKWSADEIQRTVYAVRVERKRKIYLHRQILGFPDCRVDHKNKNGCDCRRQNLRPSTGSQNSANGIKKGNSSKYKGVGWDKSRNLWRAQIKVNYKGRFLGRYGTETHAAKAYDRAAIAAWGEFATLNFPIT